MSGLRTAEATGTGASAQNATTPARAALPVVVSTNHGIPSSVNAFPVTDTPVAASSAANAPPPRRRCVVVTRPRYPAAPVRISSFLRGSGCGRGRQDRRLCAAEPRTAR